MCGVDELMENCDLVNNIFPVRTFELQVGFQAQYPLRIPQPDPQYALLTEFGYDDIIDNLDFDCFKARMRKRAVNSAIYIIERIGENTPRSKFETYCRFREYKQRLAITRACSRLNSPSRLNFPGDRFVMYVGSSTKCRIETRIKQHMGDNTQGKTYALHLKYWFAGECKLTIRQYQDNISRDVLQLIEDDLADQLKPAFGKMGGNNR